jgi:hypothetical protein
MHCDAEQLSPVAAAEQKAVHPASAAPRNVPKARRKIDAASVRSEASISRTVTRAEVLSARLVGIVHLPNPWPCGIALRWCRCRKRTAVAGASAVGHSYAGPTGPETIRACDHQVIKPYYLLVGKAKSAMKDQWDFVDTFASGSYPVSARSRALVTMHCRASNGRPVAPSSRRFGASLRQSHPLRGLTASKTGQR